MSPSVMVTLEPREPLLLYITATTKAISMVLVAERPEPPQPQETKEASVNGSGSKDPELAESPGVRVAAGPSSWRCPQLLIPKAEPIAALRPSTTRYFGIPGATRPQDLSPWR
jgi:hypothetical protein